MGCSRHPECDLLDCMGTSRGPRVNRRWVAMHHPKRGTCYRRALTALSYHATAPPPSLRWGGVGRVLASPIKYAVEGQEVLGLRKPKHEVGRP